MSGASSRTKGIFCIVAAAFGFAFMSVFVRMAGDLPSFEKAFFRNFVAVMVMTFIILRRRIGVLPAKENVADIFFRSLFGTIGIVCNFYAIDHLVLSDATILNKLSPFFAILFSVLLLKEKPNVIQIMGTTVALVGSVFVIKPGFDNPAIFASVMGLISGAAAGAAYTYVRKLGKEGEESEHIIFWFSLFSCVVCLPFMIHDYVPMSAFQLFCLIMAGVSASIGQFGITKAYLYAPAKEISVYDYTQIIFAALLGWMLFGQIPDLASVIGYLVICGAGVAMFIYNGKR